MSEDTLQRQADSTATAKTSVKRKGADNIATLEMWYYRLVGFYEQNRNLVIGLGIGIVLVIGAVLFWSQRKAALEIEATESLAKVMRAYKDGDWSAALEGDSTHIGLHKLVERYSGTASGELAKFYLACALYQRNALDSAITFYKSVSTSAPLLKAAAMAGEAACYEQKKQYKQAAELYRKAATTAQNQALEAFYLSDAGRAYELAGEKEEALEVFEQIKKKFPLSLEGREADKAIARLKL
jgi:tetratricopeptide (TPR) repeat protein